MKHNSLVEINQTVLSSYMLNRHRSLCFFFEADFRQRISFDCVMMIQIL